MAAKTRFGLEAFGVRRAGSFAGKAVEAPPAFVVTGRIFKDAGGRTFAAPARERTFKAG
jgi:hypothetical protein